MTGTAQEGRPVVIVGASGGVGGHLLREFDRTGPVIGTYLRHPIPGGVQLDASDGSAVAGFLREVRPRAVVLAAADADVDRCEREPTQSRRANVVVPGVLANACAAERVRLAHLSTDYVFDGLGGPYAETDRTGPVNVYGAHKLAGEKLVLASDATGLVLRTSVVYGGAQPGAVDYIVRELSARRRLALSAEQLQTPTHATDLARGISMLLKRESGGLYHLAGPETITRFELGRAVARTFGLAETSLGRSVPHSEPDRAPRPVRCGLKIDLAAHDCGYQPMSLADGLEKFRRDLTA